MLVFVWIQAAPSKCTNVQYSECQTECYLPLHLKIWKWKVGRLRPCQSSVSDVKSKKSSWWDTDKYLEHTKRVEMHTKL